MGKLTVKFSANLGFLWRDIPLDAAVRAAGKAGFDAVECHWPFDTPADVLTQALQAAGLGMIGLNTRRGDVSAGENGLSALVGREDEAQAAIREAIEYASNIGAGNVHVMAGVARGAAARTCFLQNLRFAADLATKHSITILIEPLNPIDAPGYFLMNTRQAESILQELDLPNVRLMFDFYHVQRTEGDVVQRFMDLRPWIGHVQIAAVPGRGSPDQGELDYKQILRKLVELGYRQPIGAEYRPDGKTEDSLSWLSDFQAT